MMVRIFQSKITKPTEGDGTCHFFNSPLLFSADERLETENLKSKEIAVVPLRTEKEDCL